MSEYHAQIRRAKTAGSVAYRVGKALASNPYTAMHLRNAFREGYRAASTAWNDEARSKQCAFLDYRLPCGRCGAIFTSGKEFSQHRCGERV